MASVKHELKQGPTAAITAAAPVSLLAALFSPVSRALALLRDWQRRSATREALVGLQDHMLEDVGLTRADVEVEATRPFWRPLDCEMLERRRRDNYWLWQRPAAPYRG